MKRSCFNFIMQADASVWCSSGPETCGQSPKLTREKIKTNCKHWLWNVKFSGNLIKNVMQRKLSTQILVSRLPTQHFKALWGATSATKTLNMQRSNSIVSWMSSALLACTAVLVTHHTYRRSLLTDGSTGAWEPRVTLKHTNTGITAALT